METYELEKAIWSEADFGQMGWHDVLIWGMLANPDSFEYLFDLDYIFKWVHPKEEETVFSFWIAPVTMVFYRAHDISIDIDSSQGTIEIADLNMEEPRKTGNNMLTEYFFRFDCQEGEISLWATGFQLFVRQHPVHRQVQHFNLQERKGISFER